MIKKGLAILIVTLLGITFSQKFFLIIVGLFILYCIIRFGADIFWWGRDQGRW